MSDNIARFNQLSGNVVCDTMVARETVRGPLADFPSISHKRGTNVNGVLLNNSTVTADSMIIGGYDLHNAKITYLTQTNFNSGTYRIKEKGIYVLKENISFEPIPAKERADKPDIGWFAAITVECEGVVIDLNGYELGASANFVASHINKVYSNIELSNAPFPGMPFPVHTISFKGETTFKPAKGVWIRNGRSGLSSHHGIHGNGNTEIVISGMTFSNHEVTAITLNSPYNVKIRDCTINGNRHEITNRSRTAQLQTLLTSLKRYSTNVEYAAHHSAINSTLTTELSARSQDPITIPDGNTYGISIGASPASGGNRFNDAECANVPDLGYQRLPSEVTISNVTINDIRGAPNQQVCVVGNIAVSPYGGPVPAPFEQQIVTNHAGAFGALQWGDFYPGGSWGPNNVAKAQVWLLKQRRIELAIDEADSYFLPTGFEANILGGSPSEGTFLSHAKPGFAFDIAHVNKGVFGIKFGCVQNGRITGCNITKVQNTALPSLLRSDIAMGGSFSDADAGLDTRYTGVDAFGISLENCKNCVVNCTRAVDIISDNGHSHGLSLFGESSTNTVVNCDFQSVQSVADPATPDVPNPVSKSYGVCVESSSGNLISGVHTRNVFGPRYACGFANLADSSRNQFTHNMCHMAHADATAHAGKLKKVSGFLNEGDALLSNCTSSANYIAGDEAEGALTGNLCHGFELTGDRQYVDSCTAACNDGGAGKSYGVSLSGDNGYTTGVKTLKNYSSNSFGEGHGFSDTGAGNVHDSSNVSAANQTSD